MDLVYSGELLLNLQELFSDQLSLLCQKKLDLLLFTHRYPARLAQYAKIPRHTLLHCRRQSGMNFGCYERVNSNVDF